MVAVVFSGGREREWRESRFEGAAVVFLAVVVIAAMEIEKRVSSD